MYRLKEGRRYRLHMRNASDHIHPIHLHRHSFELTKVAGQPISGVMKDMVTVGGYQEWKLISLRIILGLRCSTVISNCTWISGLWPVRVRQVPCFFIVHPGDQILTNG
jgi:Multicopper oxidase